MQADYYATLIAGQKPPRGDDDAFDQHVLACILSAAKSEMEEGGLSCRGTTGLETRALRHVLDRYFPLSNLAFFADDEAEDAPGPLMEEEILCDLLLQYAREDLPLSRVLAHMIACRALYEDHLWQDLGLLERKELTRMLNRHFPVLAAGNTENMKWKKYFYRKLCEAEGFSLCTAPSCKECGDFEDCFGEETGESRMARLKNSAEPASGWSGELVAAE